MTEENLANPEKDGKKAKKSSVEKGENAEKTPTELENVEVESDEIDLESNAIDQQEITVNVETKVSSEVTNDEDDIEEFSEEDEEAEEVLIEEDTDFENYEKKDFAILAEKMLAAIEKPSIRIPDIKNIDSVIHEISPLFEEKIQKEKKEAKEKYKAENGSEEGFEYKNDNYTIRFESAMVQIKEKRKEFFTNLELKRENYFETKSKLLERLREIVEREELGASKENWEALKEVQNEWRSIGNLQSPHNGSLWSAYNALNDRFFDLRSIQHELKELDQKKNLEAKELVVEQVEEMAQEIKKNGLTNSSMKKANELLNEYKHIGPGTRAEQQILWDRMKAAFDIIYDKKRELSDDNKKLSEEIYNAKLILYNRVKELADFSSDSINEWNKRTKEIMAVQEQWNALKGPMPRDKAKELSKNFWAELKGFYKKKSAFFKELESKREENYSKKIALCERVEEIISSQEVSQENSNEIINIQRKWKEIGQVPRKFNDEVYQRFKKSCDAYFNSKREENKEQNEEQKNNLDQKVALCVEIENLTKSNDIDLGKLKDFKVKFKEIGFVPRSSIKDIQDRFVKAINDYVKASGDLGKEETEKLILKNEVEVSLGTGGRNSDSGRKKSYELQKKAKNLEEEISVLKNNISFFGHSKGSEKLKAEYQTKIDKLQKELDSLNEKINILNSVQ